MGNTNKCAYMVRKGDKCECRILTENVCEYKECSFFKSHIEYERTKGRDFLYESYLKGEVSRARYVKFCKKYPSCNRTLLPQNEN
jgi:hypothetical protein